MSQVTCAAVWPRMHLHRGVFSRVAALPASRLCMSLSPAECRSESLDRINTSRCNVEQLAVLADPHTQASFEALRASRQRVRGVRDLMNLLRNRVIVFNAEDLAQVSHCHERMVRGAQGAHAADLGSRARARVSRAHTRR